MSKKIKKSFEFVLEEAISYHKEGQEAYCKNLKLIAPANKHRDHTLKLKQGFFQAIKSLQTSQVTQDSVSETTQSDMSGKDIIGILMMSSIDLITYFDVFKNLMCQGCCELEDGTKMTPFIWDKIDLEDGERLLGEYLINFTLSSLTEGSMTK